MGIALAYEVQSSIHSGRPARLALEMNKAEEPMVNGRNAALFGIPLWAGLAMACGGADSSAIEGSSPATPIDPGAADAGGFGPALDAGACLQEPDPPPPSSSAPELVLKDEPPLLSGTFMQPKAPEVMASAVNVTGISAEGYGVISNTHARQKKIYFVTSLGDDDKADNLAYLTPGTFRWALNKAKVEGGGYILFRVSGVIQLARTAYVASNTYIAGQTGNIAIKNRPIIVANASNVVIRNIRHRGDLPRGGDVMSIENSKNVLVDHCSLPWTKDGSIDIVRSTDVTIQNSYMGDGVDTGIKEEPYHSFPHLVRTESNRITFIRNLYSHVNARIPFVQGTNSSDFGGEFSNNIVYNYMDYPSLVDVGKMNFVGNIYMGGKNTKADFVRGMIMGHNSSVYVWDNLALGFENSQTGRSLGSHDATLFASMPLKTLRLPKHEQVFVVGRVAHIGVDDAEVKLSISPSRFDTPPVTYVPVVENYERVLNAFGAFPRDATDKRMAAEVRASRDPALMWDKEKIGYFRMVPAADVNTYEPFDIVDADQDGIDDRWAKPATLPEGRDLLELYLEDTMNKLAPPSVVGPAGNPCGK